VNAAEAARYLAVLGVPRRPPGRDALAEVVSAHLQRVPFENLSKLRRARAGRHGVPDLGEFLDGVEQFRFGGTCYTNNSHLNALLTHLGYDAVLCGAEMSRPDVHLVNLVRLDGREYLVDGGYGAPFLEPMPSDLDRDLEWSLGRERFVLQPRNGEGRSRMLLYRDGQHRHGYLVNPVPRALSHFDGVIEQSFAPDSTFMKRVTYIRFAPGRSWILQNLNLLEFEGAASRTSRLEPDQLPAALEGVFGVPGAIARETLEGFPVPDGVWE